jgi:hypothetical protein
MRARGRCVARLGMGGIDWVSHLGLAGTFVVLCAYAGVVASAGPEHAPRLWLCPWKALTGLPCPTCGILRSLAAALRGDWYSCLAFHPLCPLIVGTLACLSFLCVRGMLRREPVSLGGVAAWYLLLLGVACWVAKLASPVARW